MDRLTGAGIAAVLLMVFVFQTYVFAVEAKGEGGDVSGTITVEDVKQDNGIQEEETTSYSEYEKQPIAFGAENNKKSGVKSDELKGNAEEQSPVGVVVRIVGSLCLLLGGGWVALVFVKKFLPGGKNLFSSSGVEVLSRTAVDSRHHVALLRIGKRVIVAGMGSGTMSPLDVITDEDEVAEVMRHCRPKTEAGKNMFRQMLERTLPDKEKPEVQVIEKDDMQKQLSAIQDQLRGLRG
jgi:flagellar biogenesis protein FliO